MIDKLREFDEVHLSGHGATYCDGEVHVRLPGGWAGNHKPDAWRWREYKCDCQAWADGTAMQ